MEIRLEVVKGPHRGDVFTFADRDNFLVGRAKCAHFRLPKKDLRFSRVHFMIEVNPPRCQIVDMGSRNGTWVNGKRVTQCELSDGDKIRAGHTLLRVCVNPVSEMQEVPEDAGDCEPEVAVSPPPAALPMPVNEIETPVKPPPPAASDSGLEVTLDVDSPTPATPVPEVSPVRSSGPPPLPNSAASRKASPGPTNGLAQENLPKAPADSEVASAPIGDLDSLSDQESIPRLPGYEVVRELGRGGLGIVYLARKRNTGEEVAIKTIKMAQVGSDREIKRFLREAEILRELWHPHIVRFYELGQQEKVLCFVMEYVAGTDASRLLKRRGPLPVSAAVDLVSQILYALHYAHSRGYVHRDIKPANLLIGRSEGRTICKLADFGLARTYQCSSVSGITMMGDVGGTPAFMPPEQITDYRGVGAAADQYSAAATLYRLLTGEYAFDFHPKAGQKNLLKVVFEEPVPIRQRRPDLPAKLAEAIHRAMAKEPAERFPDISDLHSALMPFTASG